MQNSRSLVWAAVSALFAVSVTYAMGFFSRKNHMPVEGKTVLLTGASEGMGRSIAVKLAAKGANVVAVARNATRLEELLDELKAAAKNPSTQRFTYLTADVSTEDYAPPIVDAATVWNGGRAPDICWCVAGLATPGLFAETSMSVVRRNTNVNFFGTAEMAHAILRSWLASDAPKYAGQGPRRLIFTSTVAALFPVAGYSPYSPSKCALRGLADTLSHEMLLYPEADVRVHIVYPGTITSPGFEKENETKPEITKIIEEIDPIQTPDEAADAAFHGLERGYYAVTLAWLGHVMRWGALGGSLRNNWFVDTLMTLIMPIIWVFVLPDVLGKIRGYAKKYRHPCEHPKPGSGGQSS